MKIVQNSKSLNIDRALTCVCMKLLQSMHFWSPTNSKRNMLSGLPHDFHVKQECGRKMSNAAVIHARYSRPTIKIWNVLCRDFVLLWHNYSSRWAKQFLRVSLKLLIVLLSKESLTIATKTRYSMIFTLEGFVRAEIYLFCALTTMFLKSEQTKGVAELDLFYWPNME